MLRKIRAETFLYVKYYELVKRKQPNDTWLNFSAGRFFISDFRATTNATARGAKFFFHLKRKIIDTHTHTQYRDSIDAYLEQS